MKKELIPRVVGPCADKIVDIESNMKLIGIHVNNWQRRTIKLYEDPATVGTTDEFVYSVGRFHDNSTIVVAHERLSECMNFRVAIDYWKHGKKIYTRD